MGTSYNKQENISGFVGLAFALFMFGAALGQFYVYFRSFPNDILLLKYLVVLMFIISTYQIYLMTDIEWWFLVGSHHADPMRATLWQSQAGLGTSMTISFIVQSFYGKRLWIISQQNKTITGLVWLLSFSQFLFGMISALWHAPQSKPIYSPFTGLYGFLGVACDTLITASVYFYLRPGRSGVKRTGSGIQRLVVMTIHMGALTSTVALAVAINWVFREGSSTILTPVMIVAQSYVNSMLAMLNARKSGYAEVYMGTIQVPTLPAIHVSGPEMAMTSEAEGRQKPSVA